MALPRQVAQGVYRLGTDWVGWYLIVDEDSVTVLDCGFAGYHDQLPEALAALDRPLDSVAAIVLTHYHSDHVGSAERIRTETGAAVYVPAGDAEGVRTGKVPAPPGFMASIWRPRMMRYLSHAIRQGGASPKPVKEAKTYDDGELIAGLRAVHTPGHTAGHCSLLSERTGVLFAGDALAAFSFLSGETGPQLPAFNEDAGSARDSLSRLEGVDAGLVVFGHGEPFEGPPAQAVAAARARLG